MKAVILCPSLHQPCGIASYSRYVGHALKAQAIEAQVVATIEEAESHSDQGPTTLIIQHEYGLYDHFAVDHQSPTAVEVISLAERVNRKSPDNRACVVMHTFHPTDHVYACINRQLISSRIPIYHLNRLGAACFGLRYLEHGVHLLQEKRRWQLSSRKKDPFQLGSFGFLSPNKNIRGLIDIAAKAGAGIVANFATHDHEYADELRRYAQSREVSFRLTTDFVDEEEILERLKNADACVTIQEAIRHFATSGSIRFLMNLKVPIICSAEARQFDDLGHAVLRSSTKNLPSLIHQIMEDSSVYDQCVSNIERFTKENEVGKIYRELLVELQAKPINMSSSFASDDFKTPYNCLDWSNILPSLENKEVDAADNQALLAAMQRGACLTEKSPPYRLPAINDIRKLNGSDLTAVACLERNLASYDSVLQLLRRNVPKGATKLLTTKSFKSVAHEIVSNDFSHEEMIEVLDTLQKPQQADRWKAISQQYRQWLLAEVVRAQRTDASVEAALMSSMMVGKGGTLALLQSMLPTKQKLIHDYVARSGHAPERLAKRWRWLNDLHGYLMEKANADDRNAGCVQSHWIGRQVFWVEEFLWLDDASFRKNAEMAFLKQIPQSEDGKRDAKGDSDKSALSQLSEDIDNTYLRLCTIVSLYCEANEKRGIPIVLLFSWPQDEGIDNWEERTLKACRHIRFMIADSQIMQLHQPQLRTRSSNHEGARPTIQHLRQLFERGMRELPTSDANLQEDPIATALEGLVPGLAGSYLPLWRAEKLVKAIN